MVDSPPVPALAALGRADELCDVGRFAEARAAVGALEGAEAWRDAAALCVAARLESHSGSGARARRLSLLAFRRDPTLERAMFLTGLTCLQLRGPLEAWRWCEGRPAPRGRYGWWLAAIIATALKRFEAADTALAEAAASGDDAYTSVLRARRLLAEDRDDEALETAREALAAAPHATSSVLELAELLHARERLDEAIELVSTATRDGDSPWLGVREAALLLEALRPAEALEACERASARFHGPGEQELTVLARLESDSRRALGDRDGALAAARRASGRFHEHIVERLAAGATGRRLRLDVPYRRQHHLACVPACLEMIGAYYGLPVDRVEAAREICYSGTSSHAERRWATEHGFACREFTVTWEAAVALIDRGLPFRLDTVGATNAHAVVVCGYDAPLRLLLLQDPGSPGSVEMMADSLFEDQAAWGPRGMVLIPEARAAELGPIALPDLELYDLLDTAQRCLAQGHRERGACATRALIERAPAHGVTARARDALAVFDGNLPELSAIVDERLASFPEATALELRRLGLLAELGEGARRLTELESLGSLDGAHPAFGEQLALAWSADHRKRDEARRLVRTVGRVLGATPALAGTLGELAWSAGDRPRALEAFQVALALDPTHDGWARRYFDTALSLGAAGPALDWLRARARRHARSTTAPVLRLAFALDRVNATPEALEWLESARLAHPEDAELTCYTVELCARSGQLDRARETLQTARGSMATATWQRSSALVAELSGDIPAALRHAHQAVAAAPADADAQAHVARLLATHRGPYSARAWLQAACADFPHDARLRGLLCRHRDGLEPGLAAKLVEELLAISPGDAWAWRELSLCRAEANDFDGARQALGEALAISPHHPSAHLVGARVAELAGDPREAEARYQAALEAWPDCGDAIAALVDGATTPKRAQARLDEIERLVVARGETGDGVVAWFLGARARRKPAAVDRRLAAIELARPDCWAATSCRVQLAIAERDGGAARALASKGTTAFPHLPRSWLDLAEAERLCGRPEEAARAAAQALLLGSGWPPAAVLVASLARERGDCEAALDAIRRGLRGSPRDEGLLLREVVLLRETGRSDEARAALERALELAPTSDAVWEEFVSWHAADAPLRAQALIAEHPWNARLRLRLAALEAATQPQAALARLDAILVDEPRLTDAHDLRARLLLDLAGCAAAEEACRPPSFGDSPPMELRGRAAWIAWVCGRPDEARERLRALVRSHPTYVWGQLVLIEWDLAAEDAPSAFRQARRLLRATPRSSSAHEALGDALAALQRPRRAASAYERALALDPTNESALDSACALHAGRGDLEAARAILAAHEARMRPILRECVRLRLTVAERWLRRAHEHALTILADPACGSGHVRFTISQLAAAGPDPLLTMLESALGMDEAGRPLPASAPTLASVWAEQRVERRLLPGARELDALRARSEDAWRAALVGLLGALGDLRAPLPAIGLVLRNWRSARLDTDLWGKFGYVLASSGAWSWTLLWHLGWELRDAQPWMLQNAAMAFVHLGMFRTGVAVARAASRLPGADGLPLLGALQALDAAMDDRVADARHILATVAETPGTYHGLIRALAARLVDLDAPPPQDRSSATQAAFAGLEAACGPLRRALAPLAGSLRRRAARAIARKAGPRAWARGYAPTLLFWLWLTGFALVLIGPAAARNLALFWAAFIAMTLAARSLGAVFSRGSF